MALDDSRIVIDQKSLTSFNAAMRLYQEVTGKSLAEVVRRSSIDLMKSLRAMTTKSKKRRTVEAVQRGGRAVWMTGKHGRFKGQKVKLFRVDVRGKWKMKVGTRISEVKKYPIAQIRRQGLAKRSWGWAMHKLFNTPDKSVGDDPKIFSRSVRSKLIDEREEAGVEVSNRLDYIRNALPKGAVTMAMKKAEASIMWKVKNEIAKNAKKAGLA